MKLSIKHNLKKSMLIRNIYFLLQGTKNFLRFDTILLIKKYIWFFKQYRKFNNIEKNKRFNHTEFLPCLFDNVSYSPVDPTYFFQDSCAAKNIFGSSSPTCACAISSALSEIFLVRFWAIIKHSLSAMQLISSFL